MPQSLDTDSPHPPSKGGLVLSFVVFALLLIAGFLVIRPVSTALRQRMEILRDQLLSRGEELIGRRIEYESLGPSFLGGIDIRSLKVLGKGPIPLLSASRFRLSWSLWDLMRNDVRGIRGLQIDRPELYIDPREDRDLPELFTRIKGMAAPGEGGLSVDVFSFRIRNGNFRLEDSGSLSNINLDAEIRNGRIEAQGIWDAEFRLGEQFVTGVFSEFDLAPVLARLPGGPSLNLSAAGRFRLSCESDLSGGTAFVSLPFVAEDRFRSDSLELNLELKDRLLSLSNESPGMAGKSPLSIALDYGLDTGEISGRLSARSYSPGDTLKLLGSLKDYNRFLTLRATGDAAFNYSAGGFDYRADLSGRIPPNLPLGNSGFAVKLAGNRDRIDFDRVELVLVRGNRRDRPGGTLGFRGGVDLHSLNPAGILSVSDLSFTGRGSIDTVLSVGSRGRDIHVVGERLSAGGAEFTALELDLHREEGGLNFSATGQSGAEALIRVDGTLDYAPLHLETRITLDSFSAWDFAKAALPLVERFELPDRLPPVVPRIWGSLLEDTQVTTELFASTDFDQILYNAPRLVISYSGYKDLIALFSLSGTGRHFTVDGGQILWNGGSVGITGQSDFSDTENITFSLNAGYGDLNYYLEGALLDRRSLSIQGSYGLNGFVISMGDGNYSGRLQGENIPVQIGERIASAGFNLDMGYRSAESWFLELAGLELEDFAASGLGNTGLLRLSGRADQSQILVRDIYFDDSLGALRGGGSFSPVGNGEYRGNLSIFGDGHEESYTVDLSWVSAERRGEEWRGVPGFLDNLSWSKGPSAFWNTLSILEFPWSPEKSQSPPQSAEFSTEFFAESSVANSGESFTSVESLAEDSGESPGLKLRVSGAGMRLGRFFSKIPNIRADGVLDLEWQSLKDFNARLSIRSLGAVQGGREISAGGQAFIDSRGLRFEDLRLAVGKLEILAPRLLLSMDESRIEGNGRIQGKFSSTELALNFSLDSQFASMDSWLDYAAALENLQGTIELRDVVIGGHSGNEPYNFVFSRQGEGLVFSGGPEDMIFFNIKQGGAFIAAFADPFPVRGTLQGTLGFDGINAQGDNIFVNLPAVWQFSPTRDEFDISAGHAIGSLQIRGPLGNPEIYGRARGEDLRMRVPRFVTNDIIPVNMTLVFDGNEIRFDDTAVSSGRGRGTVRGRFLLEKWVSDTFSLNIAVGKDHPLPFKFDVGGILAQGTTSGVLNLDMVGRILNISGDLIAQETEISLNAAEIAAAQRGELWEGSDIPVITDITITAGKKVEFLWPTREFPMLQAYADLGARAKVYVNSLDRSFTFTGDVKLRGGEVFYFERSFYIRNGILTFREDQNQFDPRITVRAETRDRASNGPVTISMVVDNAPLQSFTPRFESRPALSQMEILSLLGQNIVGAAGEDGSIAAPFLSSSADLLSQSQVMRRMQGALRDLLHLDMFSVRTQFIQRAAFSFMGIQDRPVDRIGWVGNYFDNTSVFIGKYIGSEMFAQAMLSLRYDEKKRTFGGYTFEPDFGIELRSPLGNIQWNLVPTHPENWYIDDISFTISWNFSF
jgi:hypothetical protein